jgi:hypothetical protein
MNTGVQLTMKSKGDYSTTRQYMDKEKSCSEKADALMLRCIHEHKE